jgi:hypothetical protein
VPCYSGLRAAQTSSVEMFMPLPSRKTTRGWCCCSLCFVDVVLLLAEVRVNPSFSSMSICSFYWILPAISCQYVREKVLVHVKMMQPREGAVTTKNFRISYHRFKTCLYHESIRNLYVTFSMINWNQLFVWLEKSSAAYLLQCNHEENFSCFCGNPISFELYNLIVSCYP